MDTSTIIRALRCICSNAESEGNYCSQCPFHKAGKIVEGLHDDADFYKDGEAYVWVCDYDAVCIAAADALECLANA